MGELNMRLHMILNMLAVLSVHKDWKVTEKGGKGRGEKRGGKKGGGKSAEVEIPKMQGPGAVRRLISSSFGRGALLAYLG
jgi:hypothetical protein